jgi:hypothetical protein
VCYNKREISVRSSAADGGLLKVKKEKIKIAIIGCGRFAQHFVPLFKAHPEVEQV